MSKFTHKVPKLEPPSLYCGECRQWVPQTQGMVKKVGAGYFVCDDCASQANAEAPGYHSSART